MIPLKKAKKPLRYPSGDYQANEVRDARGLIVDPSTLPNVWSLKKEETPQK